MPEDSKTLERCVRELRQIWKELDGRRYDRTAQRDSELDHQLDRMNRVLLELERLAVARWSG